MYVNRLSRHVKFFPISILFHSLCLFPIMQQQQQQLFQTTRPCTIKGSSQRKKSIKVKQS